MDIFQTMCFQFTFFQFRNLKILTKLLCTLKKLFSKVEDLSGSETPQISQTKIQFDPEILSFSSQNALKMVQKQPIFSSVLWISSSYRFRESLYLWKQLFQLTRKHYSKFEVLKLKKCKLKTNWLKNVHVQNLGFDDY